MGRKSRAKAAHRAARENSAPRAVPPIFADSSQQADMGTVRKPMVSPSATRQQTYERLRELVARRVAAQEAVDEEIRALLGQGCRWTAIGQALGVSRQAARQAVPATPGERRFPVQGVTGWRDERAGESA